MRYNKFLYRFSYILKISEFIWILFIFLCSHRKIKGSGSGKSSSWSSQNFSTFSLTAWESIVCSLVKWINPFTGLFIITNHSCSKIYLAIISCCLTTAKSSLAMITSFTFLILLQAFICFTIVFTTSASSWDNCRK